MSGAWHQNLLCQARHSSRQAVESLLEYGDHGIELTCYEKRGLANIGSAGKCRQFPIPVRVPIPVESASEAGPLELSCVKVQICFSQPRRERFRYCAAVEKRFRLVEQKTPALVRRCIARRRVQRHEHRLADVGFELRLGLAWFLEIELVKLLFACHLFHRLGRANVRPRSLTIRHAQENDRPENVGPQQCTTRSDRRPPVVSYDDCLCLPEGIDEADNISAQLENVVVIDSLWPIFLAVPGLVRPDDVVSCLSQRLQLVPPRVPQLRKAVANDNYGST